MFRNYFVTAWRSLVKNRVYSIINVLGLALGLAVAMLIGTWIYDEVGTNKSFKNHARISQLFGHLTLGGEIFTGNDTPAPVAEEIRSKYPEVEQVAMTTWPKDLVISHNKKKIIRKSFYVEPTFYDMFSVNVVQGTLPKTGDNSSILLSGKLARELFGDNALGQTVKVGQKQLFTVAGIYEDFPSNSYFESTDMLIPLSYYFTIGPYEQKLRDDWDGFSFHCYILMREGSSLEAFNAKITNILYDHVSDDGKSMDPKVFFYEMDKWHLYGEFKNGVNAGGRIQFVIMFGIVGALVLVLACINFINLSTARSHTRFKEIGVRKVMGSLRHQLTMQFLSESFLVVLLGFVISLLLVLLALPWFNNLVEKKMNIPFMEPGFVIGAVVLIIFTSLVAGAYPSLYLASFKPVNALKKQLTTNKKSWERRIMVGFQFVASTVLIVTTGAVFRQIQFAKDRPTGFDMEGIFHLPMKTDPLKNADYNSVRTELFATGVVENAALADFPVTGNMSADPSLDWEGRDKSSAPLIALNSCSHDFPSASGFQFVRGRDFSRDFASDSLAVIINEQAAKIIDAKEALGKKITLRGKSRTVVGVIRDQIRWSAFQKQSAHLYFVEYPGSNDLTVRLKKGVVVPDALKRVEAVIKKFDDEAAFDYEFLDDDYANQFEAEVRMGKLTSAFSSLAIFISCIGMFGMVAFAAGQRTKEIAIRKVLGASVVNVWKNLSGDFMRLVLVSIVIATPVAYYFVTDWLEQYEYRIGMPWVLFFMAGGMTIALTLVTISFQTVKAALANPVDSLRSE